MPTLLLASVLLQAAPLVTAPTAEPPMAVLAKAFSGCIRGQLPKVPPSLTPEAGADWVFGQCEKERTAITTEVETLTASATEDQKKAARAELAAGLAEGRTAVVDAITRLRQSGR